MTIQKEYIGFETIRNLLSILSGFSHSKIFVIKGEKSFELSGAKEIFNDVLTPFSVFYHSYRAPNPEIADVVKSLEIYKQQNPDVIIAVGGGSVIDTAKLIRFFASNDISPQDWFNDKKTKIKRGIPLIAIPTTSGSGSEATHFAVMYIGKEKNSVEHESILPDIAIVDPIFTKNLSHYITASSGMDALSQAIESYWSINSTAESKKIAAEAIMLLSSNIVKAVKQPSPDNRLAMAKGAHLAGKAIKITKTTAVHAISYPMTSYFGIPHGHACGMLLPGMFDYISGVTDSDCSDSRGEDYVREILKEIASLLGRDGIEDTPEFLSNLLFKVGLETKLNAVGVNSKRDIDIIVKNAFNPERVKKNPRILSNSSLTHLLESIAV